MRECGDCNLCCKLLPVVPLGKGAGERCKHQRHTGCRVYHQPPMPSECAFWNCRWLINDDTAKLSRPDRSRYVIDMMPDFVEVQDNDTGVKLPLQVVQIWVDPKHPEAWQDPDLLAYLERRGVEGIAAIIRYNSKDAFVLMPPAMCSDGIFHDMREQGTSSMRTHTPLEIAQALGGLSITMEDDDHGEAARDARRIQDNSGGRG